MNDKSSSSGGSSRQPGPQAHEAWRELARKAGAEVKETPYGTVTTFRHMDELIAFATQVGK